MNQFENKRNNDLFRGIISNYRTKVTHALVTRNLQRFGGQLTRQIFIGTIKNLYTRQKVNIQRIAIDSSKSTVPHTKYPKFSTLSLKRKLFSGYKLHLTFDLDRKLLVAYFITPINVHDSQYLCSLIRYIGNA
jgi:hypothetical protein